MTDVVDALLARLDYVEALEAGVCGRRELAEHIGVSESAVYKAVRDLRGAGVVEEGSYELTVTGTLLLDCVRKMERIGESSEVLDDLDVPPEVLVDAVPVLPPRNAPQKPIERLEAEAERADRVRGLAPVVIQRYVTNFTEMMEGGLDAEFVVEESVFQEVRASYDAELESALESGMDLMVTGEELPYSLAIMDSDSAAIVAYDDRGRVQGALFMRSPEAVDWAEEVYESRRDEAEYVDGVAV